MVVYCFVQGCKTTKYKSSKETNHSSIPMYGFPTNETLQQKWINALLTNQDNAENPPKYSRICIKHFADDQIEQFGFLSVRLKKNAIPTIFPKVTQQREKICQDLNMEKSVLDFDDNRLEKSTLNHITEDSKQVIELNFNEMGSSTFPSEEKLNIDFNYIIEAKPQDNKEEINSTSNIEVGESDKQIIKNYKKIRYPGDFNNTELVNMSQTELIKCIKMLKKVSAKKDKIIKRLRTQQYRKDKKIESITKLLGELRKECNMSLNSSEALQVKYI